MRKVAALQSVRICVPFKVLLACANTACLEVTDLLTMAAPRCKAACWWGNATDMLTCLTVTR